MLPSATSEEAQLFQERVRTAHSVCQELKRWLEKVVVEEAVARSQLKRLEDDLRELLPALGLDLVTRPVPEAEPISSRIAAEFRAASGRGGTTRRGHRRRGATGTSPAARARPG